MKNKKNISKRREFLKKAGLVSAGAIGASTLAAPYAYAATCLLYTSDAADE